MIRYLLLSLYFLAEAAFSQSTPLIIGSFGMCNNQNEYKYGTQIQLEFGINMKFTEFEFVNYDPVYKYIGPYYTMPGNFASLTAFPSAYGYAGQGSWRYAVNDFSIPNDYIRNFDWIYFLSGAHHLSMDAARKDDLSIYEVYLRHKGGTSVEYEGEIYWWSSNEQPANGPVDLVYGPANDTVINTTKQVGLYQEIKHRSSGKVWFEDTIHYEAVFKIIPGKRIYPEPEEDLPVCNLIIKAHYKTGDVPGEDILNEVLLYESDLGNPNKLKLQYDLSAYNQNIHKNLGIPSNVKSLTGVEYVIQWIGNREIYIKEIEVYDLEIWKYHLSEPDLRIISKNKIVEHLNSIKAENPTFYNNHFKYSYAVDEPHSVDCFDALKFLNETLASLPSPHPKLWVHFYPGYDGYWGTEDILPKYYNLTAPDPLVFYTRYFGIGFNLQSALQSAYYHHLKLEAVKRAAGITPFHIVIDVWDEPNNPNIAPIDRWRAPNRTELNAAVYSALASGAKAIIYEPFYSYESSQYSQVTALVNLQSGGGYSPTWLGEYVKNTINPRLNGTFGSILSDLTYTGNTLTVRHYYNNLNTANIPESVNEVTKSWLTIKKTEVTTGTETLLKDASFFHAGLFDVPNNQYEKYMLCVNMDIDSTHSENGMPFRLGNVTTAGCRKYLVIDTETGNVLYDIKNNTSTYTTHSLLPGAASLLRVVPLVYEGGTLTENDTIQGNIPLQKNDLTISSNVTLTVNGEYTLNKNLTLCNNSEISGTGYIFRSSGTTITTANWNKSLFRSREGALVRLIWAQYPGTGTVINYRVYRKKGGSFFQLLATLSGSVLAYTDNGTQILFNPDPGNEAIAEYYVEAVISLPDDIIEYENSNNMVYNRVLSQGLEKQQVKEEKRYGYVLEQNYPNPFGSAGHSDNPGTEIRYQVSGKEGDGKLTEVKIIVYDIMGREVATLVNENIPAGSYTVNFDASNLPSGVYLYELRAGDYRSVKKMTVVK